MQDDVKGTAEMFLEYIMNNHHVNREPETLLQAFKISLVNITFIILNDLLKHQFFFKFFFGNVLLFICFSILLFQMFPCTSSKVVP